jgi:hypothetical protein
VQVFGKRGEASGAMVRSDTLDQEMGMPSVSMVREREEGELGLGVVPTLRFPGVRRVVQHTWVQDGGRGSARNNVFSRIWPIACICLFLSLPPTTSKQREGLGLQWWMTREGERSMPCLSIGGSR